MIRTPVVLPSIDLAELESGHSRHRGNALRRLRRVAHEIGFFYVENHDVPQSLGDQVLAVSRAFFALSDEAKRRIEMANSPHFRGYTRTGGELTRGLPDQREQLDVASERQPLPRDPGAPAWTRLQGPNQWPAEIPVLRPIVERWQHELTRATTRLLRAIAAALGQPDDIFDEAFSAAPIQHVKLIRYPGAGAGATLQGVGAHKDNGILTFVLQDDQPGLQVELDDNWLDVPPRRGSFVVNVGEALEMLTDGYLRATTHRVVSPENGSDRISVAFFLGPRLDARLPRLTLPPELAAGVRGVANDPLNPLFRDVGVNMLKGRLRSHPDVAQRFYADVLASQPELDAAEAGYG